MKTNPITIIAGVLAIGLSFTVHQPVRGAEDACQDAQTLAEMRQCANRRYETAKADLETVYRSLRAQLEPERQKRLQAAQDAWMEFRARHAAFEASVAEDGTLYPLIEISGLASLTEQRIEQLKAYLE